MKKLSIILALIAAVAMSSCIKPHETSISLALNNDVVVLPKSHASKDLVHYARVTSNGSWEAVLETADGRTWCWIENTYTNSKGDVVPIKGLKAVAYFDGTDLLCKVKGSGTMYVPIAFGTTSSTNHAVFTVYRPDTGERCSMRLDQ